VNYQVSNFLDFRKSSTFHPFSCIDSNSGLEKQEVGKINRGHIPRLPLFVVGAIANVALLASSLLHTFCVLWITTASSLEMYTDLVGTHSPDLLQSEELTKTLWLYIKTIGHRTGTDAMDAYSKVLPLD
jgi:hypothetical protein